MGRNSEAFGRLSEMSESARDIATMIAYSQFIESANPSTSDGNPVAVSPYDIRAYLSHLNHPDGAEYNSIASSMDRLGSAGALKKVDGNGHYYMNPVLAGIILENTRLSELHMGFHGYRNNLSFLDAEQ